MTKHLRTILLGLLMVGGLLAVPIPSQADTPAAQKAVNDNVYSFRACNTYGYPILAGKFTVCLKTYARRQSDGDGWAVNSAHVYGWSAADPSDACGEALESTTLAQVSVDNGQVTDGIKWARDANLNQNNGCDLLWRGDPMVKIGNRDVKIKYVYQAHRNAGTDPDGRDTLQVWLTTQQNGFEFACVGDICNREGPF